MVWQRYHLVHVVLIFSRNPQKILPNHFHAHFWDGFRAFWLAPGMKFVHLICPFTCIRTCAHTYEMCKPIQNQSIRAYSKNVRWLAPFGNMEYLICPFQFHPHARARPSINVVAICCTMYILPPDWPPRSVNRDLICPYVHMQHSKSVGTLEWTVINPANLEIADLNSTDNQF